MTCPKEFTTEYIVHENVQYQCVELPGRGTYSSEGTLKKGRVVWGPSLDEKQSSSMRVYAEGVGIISIAPRVVKLAE
jgi:hypothetical protein